MGTSRRSAVVLYASRRGNTRRLAEAMADSLGVKARPLAARRRGLPALVFIGARPGGARRALRALAPRLAGHRAALFCTARLFPRLTLARLRRLLPGVEVVTAQAFRPPLAAEELAEVGRAREWALRVWQLATKPVRRSKERSMATMNLRPLQRVRKGLLLLFLLLFPMVLNFLSPYLSLSGSMQGVASGSLLFFGLLLASSLFLGRAFCGWVCPGGSVQELCFAVNDRPVRGRRVDWVKYLIWVPWLGLIVFGLARAAAAGSLKVQPRYLMDSWVSIEHPAQFIVYYAVLSLIVVPSLIVGRRTMCHSICWMAPFMILGRAARNLLRWPALHLRAEPERCTACGTCTRACPMSLPVQQMVAAGQMERAECILCGNCVSSCPSGVIRFRFAAGR